MHHSRMDTSRIKGNRQQKYAGERPAGVSRSRACIEPGTGYRGHLVRQFGRALHASLDKHCVHESMKVSASQETPDHSPLSTARNRRPPLPVPHLARCRERGVGAVLLLVLTGRCAVGCSSDGGAVSGGGGVPQRQRYGWH